MYTVKCHGSKGCHFMGGVIGEQPGGSCGDTQTRTYTHKHSRPSSGWWPQEGHPIVILICWPKHRKAGMQECSVRLPGTRWGRNHCAIKAYSNNMYRPCPAGNSRFLFMLNKWMVWRDFCCTVYKESFEILN